MAELMIEVFDGENKCSGLCSCMKTTIEPVLNQMRIAELEIEKEYGKGFAEFKAYNLREINVRLADFPVVNEMVKNDYSLPILLLNGKPAMAGGITSERILEFVKEVYPKR